ncbi:alpha/beta hydrolase family protein [Occallatibacter savannae]|uniref:S9 family peptidase n=1 Tax=Occallatibacter savannae TaxID=1002691 RepID=UPI001EF4C381|nr:S9 family peptidase [Occallatibacter savannae]
MLLRSAVRLSNCAVSILAISSAAFGQNSASLKPPTIDQSLEMYNVGSPKISPDGKRVIYEQARTNWDANTFETDLWIADVGSRERHLLTATGHSCNSAEWSPDGKWIAFASDRPGALPKSPDGKRQLWIMPADGGEAQQLTKMEKGIGGFEWAPDSRRIAFNAEAPEAKALKDRKESFGDYQVVHADYQMMHLWLIDLPKTDAAGRMSAIADPKQLTKEDTFTIDEFSFSPDGSKIAFSAAKDPDLISEGSKDIYVIAVAGGAPKKIVDTPGPDGDPKWSPDGKQIAYVTSNGAKYFFYANQKIAVVDADGGTPRVVSDAFDEDADLLKWAPEGIYISGLQKMSSTLYLLDPSSAKLKKIAMTGSEIAAQFTFSKDFKQVAYRGAGTNQYAEIFAGAVSGGTPAKLTAAGEQESGFTVAKREVVRWKSGDGTEIEGVLYKPADFSPEKKYPLLVVIHGGPTGIDMPLLNADRYYPIERFVAKGALVLRPNYRGSAGYGEKFRALNVRNLGVGDYADVISGVDYLIGQGFVDKDRVGSMGWSEGGYISAFITTSSDRFKAVSVGAGISDWMTYYANTDITPFTPQYLRATPWDDPEVYRVTSPISYISKAKTPTLIQHGGSDHRVPIANGFELRQALEDHGVPVKMVVYDGFGHPINKPKQQRAVMEENENWFGHYIWGEPLAPALTPRPSEKKDDKDAGTK